MEVLQTTTVTVNARISIGMGTLAKLDAKVGDHLQIFEDNGRVCIAKVVPPEA